MGLGWVRRYSSSVGGLIRSIKDTTWDQTWQAASVRERWALASTIFAGSGVGWVAAIGLRSVLPVADWLFYYALWGGLYAWLGRSRSVADAPGKDPGVVRVSVGQANKLGLEILRLPNWARDVFRTLPAADQANVGRLSRWLDGPVGVIGATVLLLTLFVTSLQKRSDPVGVRVLLTFPAAFGLVASQRVYLHRKSRRAAFVEQVDREISAQLTRSGPPGQAVCSPGPDMATPSDAANSLRTQIVVGVAISLAIGLFFYLLPPQYH